MDRDARDETLDYSERWLRDGLSALRPSLSVVQVSVDMSQALARLEALRQGGVQATTTHLVVQAAARALAANPALHQIVAGSRRHRPSRVDISLSVTGETFVTPVVIIEGADRKSVAEIAADVASLAPEARAADQRLRGALKRWGWLLPFGFMRRALMRCLHTSPAFRRKAAGTFQVSTIPADWALTSTFAVTGVLIAGQVWSRVVAVEGAPAVRPVMTLTLSSDHGVWDGRAAVRFLAAVRGELESESGAA